MQSLRRAVEMTARTKQLDREIAEALQHKAPLRVVCRTLAFGIKSCQWKVDGDFRGAEFTSRKQSGSYAVVHPSTKAAKWQVSFFDEQGAVGDSHHPTAESALEQVSPERWKLRGF
jgi:hypothetical protein